uniref:Uncharacterized protein n=1 Tax=Meloidogyne enterolobii TaxID=390850 RepID=A0A6V7UKP5_MELEN|nr:unnamed protein product [Meloidogyne enterolobii]
MWLNGNWSQKAQSKNNADNSVTLKAGDKIRISINFEGFNDIKPIIETEQYIIQDKIVYSYSSDYGIGLIEYIRVNELKKIVGTDFIKIKRKLN